MRTNRGSTVCNYFWSMIINCINVILTLKLVLKCSQYKIDEFQLKNFICLKLPPSNRRSSSTEMRRSNIDCILVARYFTKISWISLRWVIAGYSLTRPMNERFQTWQFKVIYCLCLNQRVVHCMVIKSSGLKKHILPWSWKFIILVDLYEF